MKRLILLGASGSIGTQTLDVIRMHPDKFMLTAFGVGRNIDMFRRIQAEFPVSEATVEREEDAVLLRQEYPHVTILSGEEGMCRLAKRQDYDILVNALVGFAGFLPTWHAIRSDHDVALANKETLVVGGELIDQALREHGRKLLPIDSEHSAIFQCLQGNQTSQVKRLIITASGGSFRRLSRDELRDVTVEQALAHPNWNMGAKITIDSATMMNKGFEVMEAHWLFGLPYEQIDVLMHPESIVHSMVEYQDHSVMAQLGNPDMRLPIQYALSWPDRLELEQEKPLDLAAVGSLHFSAPDTRRYPLLGLAYETAKKGGTLPAVLNGANEVANLAFRNKEISFLDIEDILVRAVFRAGRKEVHDVQDLLDADAWGRGYAEYLIRGTKQ